MAADCAIELKRHNVACISLWPGAVRTELVTSIISQVVNIYVFFHQQADFPASYKIFRKIR